MHLLRRTSVDEQLGSRPPSLELRRRGELASEDHAVPPLVREVAASTGYPLDPAIGGFFSSRFHHDFSDVRVHSDARAAESARAIDAAAYTFGRHIVFASGGYAPATDAGKRLLAHELTHVMQQSSPTASVVPGIGAAHSPHERHADRSASLLRSGPVEASHSTMVPAVMRQQAVPAPRRFDLPIGRDELRDVTLPQAVAALRQFHRRLSITVGSDRDRHRAQRAIRDSQRVVSAVSDFFAAPLHGGINLPAEGIWATPQQELDGAAAALDSGNVDLAARDLSEAERSAQDAHRSLYAYIDGTISSAQTSATTLKVTAFVGAVAATAAGGSIAAAAGRGLVGVATATGLVGGEYGAVQALAGQGGEIIAGDRQHYDIAAVLRRGAIDAATNFVGALAGGALSRYATRFFGSYLSKISDSALVELGEQLGLGGALPRDFFLTQGQRRIADFLSGVGITPLTTAVSVVVNRLTGGGELPSGRDFARLVIEEMVRGGALQLFLGTILHGRASAGEGTAGSGSRGTRSTPPSRSGSASPSSWGSRVRSTLRSRLLAATLRGAAEGAPPLRGTGAAPSPITIRDGISLAFETRARTVTEPSSVRPTASNPPEVTRTSSEATSTSRNPLENVDPEVSAAVDRALDEGTASTPDVTGGKRPYVDKHKVATNQRRRMDIEDIRPLAGETSRQALTRVREIIGRRISDIASLNAAWQRARARVLATDTLTAATYKPLYKLTRKQFWREVRSDPAAIGYFTDRGFAFGEGATTAPVLAGVGPAIPPNETRVSLDHIAEKARGDNWQRALDADNLRMEFAMPNTYRETAQSRHPELRPDDED